MSNFGGWPLLEPSGREMYAPPSWKIVPPGGCWVGITRRPPPVYGNDIARAGRAFWAERSPGSDDDGKLSDGTYKVVLHGLPKGDVYLFPFEYVPIPVADLIRGWEEGRLQFVALNLEPVRLNEVTFYARTRGIPFEEAAVMALGTVERPVGWFDRCAPEQ